MFNFFLLCLFASGVGSLIRELGKALKLPDWLTFWVGLLIALFLFAVISVNVK